MFVRKNKCFFISLELLYIIKAQCNSGELIIIYDVVVEGRDSLLPLKDVSCFYSESSISPEVSPRPCTQRLSLSLSLCVGGGVGGCEEDRVRETYRVA